MVNRQLGNLAGESDSYNYFLVMLTATLFRIPLRNLHRTRWGSPP